MAKFLRKAHQFCDSQIKQVLYATLQVPRFNVCRTLVEDQEFSLCTVTLFRKVASDFKNAAREQRYLHMFINFYKWLTETSRFIVREFNFTAETFQQAKEGKEKLLVDQEQAKVRLANLCLSHDNSTKGKIIRWCKTNFAEAFVGWIHVKVRCDVGCDHLPVVVNGIWWLN